MTAAKQGTLDKAAEICVVLEAPTDPDYEAMVNRMITLKNEICPQAYPHDLDSTHVAVDPVLGPKARELAELGTRFMQLMQTKSAEFARFEEQLNSLQAEMNKEIAALGTEDRGRAQAIVESYQVRSSALQRKRDECQMLGSRMLLESGLADGRCGFKP